MPASRRCGFLLLFAHGARIEIAIDDVKVEFFLAAHESVADVY